MEGLETEPETLHRLDFLTGRWKNRADALRITGWSAIRDLPAAVDCIGGDRLQLTVRLRGTVLKYPGLRGPDWMYLASSCGHGVEHMYMYVGL